MTTFNTIPGNLVAPIFTFEVNSGGQFENRSRLLLIGHKAAAGVMPLDVPVICPTVAEARRLAGAGSILDDMVRAARAQAPVQEIWIAAATEAGSAQVRTITITAAPSAGVAAIRIAGEVISVTVASGDTVATVAAALAARINGYFNSLNSASLPYTATSAAGVVTLTARHKGDAFGSVSVTVPVLDGANVLTGKATLATTTAGAGTPNLSALLGALGDQEFDWIVSPWSDATNVENYDTLLNDTSGRWAWNRQIYGHAFYPLFDTIGNMTTHGLARDNRHLSALPVIASSGAPQPSWQWIASTVARIVPWLSDGALGNVSRNQTGLVAQGLQAPDDRTGWLDHATRESFLTSGLSTWKVNGSGQVVIDKIITTARTTLGVPDTTFRDIQKIGQLVYALRKFRADLTLQFGQKAIADDNPGNLGSLCTVKDIKAAFMQSYQDMVRTGVLENAGRAAELITVTRDSDSPNRVNIHAPLDMVNPLDIMAANAVVYSQFNRQ